MNFSSPKDRKKSNTILKHSPINFISTIVLVLSSSDRPAPLRSTILRYGTVRLKMLSIGLEIVRIKASETYILVLLQNLKELSP